jgi:CheY-like chemotaxis protein
MNHPAKCTKHPQQENKKNISSPDGRRDTILLVDDDWMIRRAGTLLLRRLGYFALTAENGREALERCNANRNIRLVILDLVMPVMGGEETLAALRKTTPSIPVVLSSGFLDSQIYLLPADGFLPKPYGLNDLAEALERILQEDTAVLQNIA